MGSSVPCDSGAHEADIVMHFFLGGGSLIFPIQHFFLANFWCVGGGGALCLRQV